MKIKDVYKVHPGMIYPKIVNINTVEKGYTNIQLNRECYGILFDDNSYLLFKVDKKHPSLFEITQLTKNGKNYFASRYHYKYIPYVMDAAYNYI